MIAEPEQLDFMDPYICPGREYNAEFIDDDCRVCGRTIMHHRDEPAWQRFTCVWCFVGRRRP